ncbi:transposase [Panacagrimonas perspica]|uniref:Transposase n=1 Tax=Panacagrimonas perspica TaxID=381431 RepID=A0A4R7NZC5_9GAMM|nr:transposase [Panacagrimonas perspica]TDU25920.1 transposase [Panacagrimonas perspica]
MARIKGPRKLYRYTAEFKLKAVKLSEAEGVQVKDVAEALCIHPWMLSKWRTQYAHGELVTERPVELDVAKAAELAELAKVKRELALLKEEHELLKKAIRFSSELKTRSSRS